ncbi:MAG: ABC-2 family transporter protein [Nocardioidaceae bacterium]
MLHAAVAARSFRRYATYRGATLAGIFTNSVFGVIYSFVYLALWRERSGLGGYDSVDAVTYVWIGQGLIMVTALWAGGPTDDLAERVRSGAIAVDLYRPVGLVSWYLAQDAGRMLFHLVTRGTVPMILGAMLFDLRPPAGVVGAAAFAISVCLGVLVSFGLRFLAAASSFWLLDASGVRTLSTVAGTFFSGMVLPLVVFPEPLRSICLALPWAAMLQTPADLWLGRHTGTGILAALSVQAAWAMALLLAARLVTHAATHKLVVQGG